MFKVKSVVALFVDQVSWLVPFARLMITCTDLYLFQVSRTASSFELFSIRFQCYGNTYSLSPSAGPIKLRMLLLASIKYESKPGTNSRGAPCSTPLFGLAFLKIF
jgi:hypothetical protein